MKKSLAQNVLVSHCGFSVYFRRAVSFFTEPTQAKYVQGRLLCNVKVGGLYFWLASHFSYVVMRFTMRSASFTWANSSEHTCESRVLPTQYTQIFLWTCVQAVSFTLIGIQWLDRHIWPPCGSLNSYCLCSAPRTQADVTLGAVAVSMHLYRRAAPKWMQKRGPAHRMGVKARVNEPLGVIYTCAGLWKAFHVGLYSKSGTGAADWHSGSDTAVSLLPNRLL